MPSATLTRPGLLDLLAQTSFAAEATRLLHQLDSGEAVQLALGEQDRDICESLSSLSLAGAASHTVGNRTSSTYLN